VTRRTGKTGSNSKAEVEKNKRLAAQRIAEGATKAEVQAELGVCRQTLGNYLQGLEIDWAALNAPAIAPLKKKMVEQLLQMADDVIAGVVSTKLADTWRGLMGDIREMLPGMNTPTTSAVMHVGSESSPLFLKFKKATAGLSEAQLEQAFAQLASVPREAVVTVRDASWFPADAPKQLESGE
jgi:hypothetical protein